MIRDLYMFTWPVTPDGYAWRHVKAPRNPHWELTWPITGGLNARVYQPMQEFTGLFRTFALTRPDRDSILAFAKRFGRLGCGTAEIPPTQGIPEQKGEFIDLGGEPFDIWVKEIRMMRRLVRLWDACCANDQAALAACIRYSNQSGVDELWYHLPSGSECEPEVDPSSPAVKDLIASASYHPERLERFHARDRFAPALTYLQDQVNRQLDQLPVRLVWQHAEGRLRRRLVPISLQSALWLQFVEAIDGEKQYRACKKCGLWFELSPEIARTSRHFCTAACRNRAYRERQEEARELHRKGKKVVEIARELGTDVKTIRGWVKTAKE